MSEISFNNEELERYNRHLILPEFNIEGQRKLKAASVLVVGAGGLGSPALLYLAAAGVGTLGIVDFDFVDESNLQRQVLFTKDDVGKLKTEAARNRLLALNPHIDVVIHNLRLTKENALEVIEKYDFVADGTDNFPTRYLINDACVLLNKVNVYASIYRFEGQVSVFNFLHQDGTRGPNYRDLFPTPPPANTVPNCAEGGVLGVLPGILGSLQANEVIKVITGIGKPLDGRLFILDAASLATRTMKLNKNPKNPLNGEHPSQTSLLDYEHFYGLEINPSRNNKDVKAISVYDLKKMRDSQEDFQLIDVREHYEYEMDNLGGDFMPQGSIHNYIDKIATNKKVILMCRSGIRSKNVILELEKKYEFSNLYNLDGGMVAWEREE